MNTAGNLQALQNGLARERWSHTFVMHLRIAAKVRWARAKVEYSKWISLRLAQTNRSKHTGSTSNLRLINLSVYPPSISKSISQNVRFTRCGRAKGVDPYRQQD
ncbi:hypothetical protein HG15A2_06220 [Adhaeretor mobilis]|uniref:Uncharacterized protein n=1 Tax=Adhaeretor mobilis TaxID=1930276 RepID=A0A517MR56_9BACT|nr:hypothetical protein HG15A2_06220 [Adhaeretor mobilis]